MSGDITYCADAKCPSRKDCRRYAGNKSGDPRKEVSMADFQRPEDAVKCDDFLPVDNEKQI